MPPSPLGLHPRSSWGTKSRQKAIQRREINTQQFNSAKPWKQVTFVVAGNNGLEWWAFAGNETSGNITQCTLLSMMNDIFFGGYGNIIEIQLHKSLAKSLICLGSRRRRQGGQEMSLQDHPRQYAVSPKKFMGFVNGYWHLVAGNKTNHICQLETTLLFSPSMLFLFFANFCWLAIPYL